jgi:anti-anti-sigma factor
MVDVSSLKLAVREVGATLHLRLGGDFDLAGVGAVESALGRLSRAPVPKRVVFDLRGLAFLDSAGLRTIESTNARGRAEAFEVVIVRPRGNANRFVALTRAGKRLTTVDESEGTPMAPDVTDDRQHRLANQRSFRPYFVECSCERGCPVCAYTQLVTKGQAKG